MNNFFYGKKILQIYSFTVISNYGLSNYGFDLEVEKLQCQTMFIGEKFINLISQEAGENVSSFKFLSGNIFSMYKVLLKYCHINKRKKA